MKAITNGRPIEILLVEDSATDVMLAEEALEYAKMRNNLHVVKDGVEAMAFLRKERQYAEVPRPDLILLDLNMPRKEGREVLAEVKADDDLKNIPVVVLTTSQAQEDVLQAYGLHANCYISKPVDFEQFANVVRAIDQFWFTVVTLPTGDTLPTGGNNG
jgi:two-component system response regulator